MAVASVKAHAPRGFWPIQDLGELAALLLLSFLISARGSGIWSLDALRAELSVDEPMALCCGSRQGVSNSTRKHGVCQEDRISRSAHARVLPSRRCTVPRGGLRARTPRRGADVEPPVSVDTIRDDPEEYLGERVRFSAHVAEIHGSRILTLRDEDPVAREQILVVTRRSLPRLLGESTALEPGHKLLVSGIVRRFDVAELRQELNVEIDPRLEQRFRGKPMIVASEVVRTDDARQGADAPDTLSPPN